MQGWVGFHRLESCLKLYVGRPEKSELASKPHLGLLGLHLIQVLLKALNNPCFVFFLKVLVDATHSFQLVCTHPFETVKRLKVSP